MLQLIGAEANIVRFHGYACVRMCERIAHVFSSLQVNDDHLAPLAFGEEGEVSTGFDLQGGAQSQSQICFPGNTQTTFTLHSIPWFNGMSGPCPVYASHAHLPVYLQGPCPLRLYTCHVTD